jgi:hypothetical protein
MLLKLKQNITTKKSILYFKELCGYLFIENYIFRITYPLN